MHFTFEKMNSLLRTVTVTTICKRFSSIDNQQFTRQARMLDRLIKKNLKKTNIAERTEPRKLKKDYLMSAYDNEASNRKIAALNKFYMDNLMELLHTSKYQPKFEEFKIEFSKVKITSCRSSINIYWVTKKKDASETEISELFGKVKKELQSQMGSLKPMRKVPFITFVKDLRLECALHIEKLFEVADFGKNFEATNPMNNTHPNSGKELQLINENSKMRENVMGLDHARIKEKIVRDIKRFQAISIKKNELEEIKHPKRLQKLMEFDKQLFARFFRKKLLLESKFRKREYEESYVEFTESYDTEKQADLHWEFMSIKKAFMEGEDLEDDEYFNYSEADYEKNYTEEEEENSNEENDSENEISKNQNLSTGKSKLS